MQESSGILYASENIVCQLLQYGISTANGSWASSWLMLGCAERCSMSQSNSSSDMLWHEEYFAPVAAATTKV